MPEQQDVGDKRGMSTASPDELSGHNSGVRATSATPEGGAAIQAKQEDDWFGNVLFLGFGVEEVEVAEAQRALTAVIQKGTPESREMARLCTQELEELSGGDDIVDSDQLAQKIGVCVMHYVAFALGDVDHSPGVRIA